ncbi:MAG TPA: UDP-N-acetylmuramoyl-tripeptide--D-alanyl-D-alanine ligase [Chloroflexota bacterium]|nr:UDP-N-acetylmuramoyl-tripeptide--D-alanyl-D-alanine ligase [Chloroflexota bacterium]
MTPVLVLALTALLILSWLRLLVLDGLRALHILQLEEYQTVRYWRWLIGHRDRTVNGVLAATALAIMLISLIAPPALAAVAAIGGIGAGIERSWRVRRPAAKKPLVLTARARRLLAGWILCSLLIGGGVLVGVRSWASGPSSVLVGGTAAVLVLTLLTWPLMSAANLVLYPVEAFLRRYYLQSARRVLRSTSPIVIGVAGSYGKTSTKSFLAQILGRREKVLATPRSFNTPMGLCRVIRESLEPDHRIFIAELGTYRRGEIRQLCRLVEPRIGVLTAVGPEHLERFGSMEDVRRAEFELIEALPPDGLAVVNGDDETCREFAARARCQCLLAGGPPHPNRTIWAEEIELTSDGLRFVLCLHDGRRAAVATPLLGRHNVSNILLAAAVALHQGFDLPDLVAAIACLEPVEHRLQPIRNASGIVVIDDTYNSNPRGAAGALEVLATFRGGRRYLVTPGMVELADFQDQAHRDLGRQAARVCDGVILVGPRQTRAIAEGLLEAGFDQDRLIVVRDLAEATERLKTLLAPGDVVLFENDLPDTYDE